MSSALRQLARRAAPQFAALRGGNAPAHGATIFFHLGDIPVTLILSFIFNVSLPLSLQALLPTTTTMMTTVITHTTPAL
jgi:hypothetical protein